MPNTSVQPILVVEDDAPLRELVVQALTQEGYAVQSAPDGSDALAHLRTRAVTPRLIVLDWRMPTPAEVFAREYRTLPGPHAPILVLTADTNAVNAVQAIGARGFLSKPFDIDELIDFVHRLAGPPVPPVPPPTLRRPGRLKTKVILTEGDRRKAALQRMAGDVQRIRAALDAVRTAMRDLMLTEQHRRLTLEEAARARQLHWQSEGLRCELTLLREQFEQLRSAPTVTRARIQARS